MDSLSKPITRQHLRELRFADRADGGHVRDAVLVGDFAQRFHARRRAFDAQVHQFIGQKAAAAAAAERASRIVSGSMS